MKLKFRASAEDWIKFLIYGIILLFFVAIAVTNITSLVRGDGFSGFNPLPAFGKEYLLSTLVLFVFAYAAIILSVQSLFAERDKGFGISTKKKKEKGYSDWATDKEMKQQLKVVNPMSEKSDHAGITLMNNGKQLWVDDGEFHSLVIGSTGSGKTEAVVFPLVRTLAKKDESMIITDPKGEIYEQTSEMLRAKGYNIILLNFREPQKGNSWNPLALPYVLYKNGNKDKANELLDDLAKNILYDENAKNQDPFWENTSADYFSGLALGLFEDGKEEEINLNSINLMTTVGEEKCGMSTYIKEYFGYKDPASPAYISAVSTILAPTETKYSILSVFKQKIKIFSSRENLSEMLSYSNFDMKDIGRKKTAVFIVVQDEKKTYHSLVTIFIKQCYETLIDIAQENGGKLSQRTNFILDEFANMPPLKEVTTMVTAARSRKIRFTFIIQNFAQLNQVYGKENADTIKGNCGNIIYLISSELAALEEISKMCGEVKSKEKDKTASTPLITVSDLQRLPMWTIIVLRTRMMPFKTVLTPNFVMKNKGMWGKDYPLGTYPQRDKKDILLFNIKEFVDQKNVEKMDKLFGPKESPMPFNPSMVKDNNFNVDDLVKRIDAKIAELEKEEEQEKTKEGAKTTKKVVSEPSKEPVWNKEEVKKIDKKNKKEVTDDEFFDDFFAEDE